MDVKRLEVLGLDWAKQAMRQPFLSSPKGPQADVELAKRLINSGREHRKFMRQVTIQIEFSASMAFLAEFDTYKIGCTRNSQSFWNTWKGKFSPQDFVLPDCDIKTMATNAECCKATKCAQMIILETLNELVELGVKKEVLRYLVPQGINYNGIFTLTGETYINMLKQRQNHRLPEWIEFLTHTILKIELLHNDFYQLIRHLIKDDSKLANNLERYESYNLSKNCMESRSAGFTPPTQPACPGVVYFENK